MDDPIGSTTWAPPPAQTQTPSTVPAKSAKSPSVAGPAGPPVVNAPPVAKDGSKPPGSEKPKGPLVPAAALQSASLSLWDDTQAAIADARRLAKSNGASQEFEDACRHLLRAVNDEVTAMVGPEASDSTTLRRAGNALVDRAGFSDKSIIAAATDEVYERRAGSHIVLHPLPPAVEAIRLSARRSAMDAAIELARGAANKSPEDAAIELVRVPAKKYPEKFPSLAIWDADFEQASKRFHDVDTLNNLGTPVLKQSLDQLQDAARFRRDAWQKAVDSAAKSDDPELEAACQRGLSAADKDVKRVTDPLFVELHENPAYARGQKADHE